MTIDDVTALMRRLERRLIKEGFYSNAYGRRGYFAEYKCPGKFLKYSVLSADVAFAPDEVSPAITASGRWNQRAHLYSNKKGQTGLEATVHSAGHAFMLTATPCS
jgi:hypothetical protein